MNIFEIHDNIINQSDFDETILSYKIKKIEYNIFNSDAFKSKVIASNVDQILCYSSRYICNFGCT